MSLEEQIVTLTSAVIDLNETMKTMVSKAKAVSGDTAGSTDAAPKKTRASTKTKAKEEDSGDDAGDGDTDSGIDVDALKGDIRTWMSEHGKGDDNAEYVARGSAFKAALEKLGANKLDEVSADDLPRVVKWLDKKKTEGKLAKPAEDEDL